MNKQTITTLIVSIITYVVLVINTLTGKSLELDPETVSAAAALIATGIMWAVSNYWNQDYTETAKKFTSIMRKVKKLLKAGDATVLDQIEKIVDEMEVK